MALTTTDGASEQSQQTGEHTLSADLSDVSIFFSLATSVILSDRFCSICLGPKSCAITSAEGNFKTFTCVCLAPFLGTQQVLNSSLKQSFFQSVLV